MSSTRSERGRLWAVGLGPGDPGLITRKAARLIRHADVVAYYRGTDRPSVARTIAEALIPHDAIEFEMRYPVTTGESDHARGYYGALEEFYDAMADGLAAHLDAGRKVVVLAEGDPLFFGSFMYLHDRLAGWYDVEVVPGVTAMAGASAAATRGLCRHEDVLTVLPGTLGTPELARRLADTDAAVIMKLGRTFPDVVEALRQAGKLERAVYVERATSSQERVLPVADVDPASVPYMSIIVVSGADRRKDSAGRHLSSRRVQQSVSRETPLPRSGSTAIGYGRVYVVGLGPGPDKWLTPEADEVLRRVQHAVGYAPYVNRIEQREGLERHASGNTVEVERARFALDLALTGQDVAVVSGGDAGVFGMAAAVFEAVENEPRYDAIDIEVLPGVTAAQAGAALAGAMLGADYAMISLSDRLKPWSLVERRLRAIGEGDLACALYNPRSASRPNQLFEAKRVLLTVKSPQTVVVVARSVGRENEELVVTTLAQFDPGIVDMQCLVLVGAASTRVSRTGRVWTPRYVEPSA